MEGDLPLAHSVAIAQAIEESFVIDLTSEDADSFNGFGADPWSAVGRSVIVPKGSSSRQGSKSSG